MSISKELSQRSESKCELCMAAENLSAYTIAPKSGDLPEHQVVLCATCLAQIENEKDMDVHHWRCLNESMWSPVPAVQVMSYRLLKKLSSEAWAQEALAMMYMDEATTEWAENVADEQVVHKDCNGNVLQAGDTVMLIQDLNVKGAGFTAKRGTAVRRIRLDPNNAEYIEGKVEGQQIVILTKYVKKQ